MELTRMTQGVKPKINFLALLWLLVNTGPETASNQDGMGPVRISNSSAQCPHPFLHPCCLFSLMVILEYSNNSHVRPSINCRTILFFVFLPIVFATGLVFLGKMGRNVYATPKHKSWGPENGNSSPVNGRRESEV